MSDKTRKIMNGDLPNYFTFEPRFETHRLSWVKCQGEVFTWSDARTLGFDVYYRLTENMLYAAVCYLRDPTKGPEIATMMVFPRATAVMQFEAREGQKTP